MADFDKWQRAVNEAANLRVQRDYSQREYSAASAERDRLARSQVQDPLAYAAAQVKMSTFEREVEAIDARIKTAELEAAREEPDLSVKRATYCALAARARAVPGYSPIEMARLDYQCQNAGMVTTSNANVTTNATPEGVPSTTASPARNLLPVLLVTAAVAGGAYLWWSSQKAASPRYP